MRSLSFPCHLHVVLCAFVFWVVSGVCERKRERRGNRMFVCCTYPLGSTKVQVVDTKACLPTERRSRTATGGKTECERRGRYIPWPVSGEARTPPLFPHDVITRRTQREGSLTCWNYWP